MKNNEQESMKFLIWNNLDKLEINSIANWLINKKYNKNDYSNFVTMIYEKKKTIQKVMNSNPRIFCNYVR
jgi:hypothetical protein